MQAGRSDTGNLGRWTTLLPGGGDARTPRLDDPDGQPGSALFLVLDDRHRLGERANRLLKRNAHAEFPHAKTRRLVSNVDVQDGANGTVRATCNFVVYRSRAGSTEIFPGHGIYDLRIESS